MTATDLHRCGRPRRTDQRPCQAVVTHPGLPCVWHAEPLLVDTPRGRLSIAPDRRHHGRLLLTFHDPDTGQPICSTVLTPDTARLLANHLVGQAANAEQRLAAADRGQP